MKKSLLLLIVVAAVAAGGFFIYKTYFTKPETKVIETAKVQQGSIRGVIVETGIIKPQVGAVVKIGARATGTIMSMKVKIGDRVKAGQLIALIDDREILKAIDQQRASVAASQNTLRQIELTYPQRIAEAQANYDYAKVNYEREKQLLTQEYTTKDSVDRARSQFEAAEATLARLREEFETQPKIVQANINEATAQLQQQETRLTYTRIYAPIEGMVSDVTAQEGETIVAGLQVANLVTVLDTTLLEMWIYVDETDIGRVKVGQQVEYYVDTFPSKIFRGTIEKVYPQPVVKDNIVYYLAIVKISREDAGSLRPEMTTHVKVIFAEKTDILIVPNGAVKFEKGKEVAYKVVGRHKVEKADLKLGIRGEENTEVLSGLKDGDEVATKLILPVVTQPEEARRKP
ncbi:MAG: efflux RND transporter periplasmic adaptor subunit [Chloroflexota bacterium]